MESAWLKSGQTHKQAALHKNTSLDD
jgi:hypothetical protein